MAGTTTSTVGRAARRWFPAAMLLWPALVLAEPGSLRAPAAAAPVQIPAPLALPTPLPPPPEAPPPVPFAADHAQEPEDAFELQVRALEERVGEAKEQVFRARARLRLLGEKVAGADLLAGAQAVIVHRNEMGSAFALESVTYRLDGVTVFDRADVDGDLAKREEFEVFRGRMMPGQHTVEVTATYRGTGYGLFKYVEGYKFRPQSSYEFTCEGGKVTTVKVVGYEKGGITAELEHRPAVRFDVSTTRDTSTRPAEARR